ncbi:hypothetical protein BT93_H3671 [Corymbia citriodora subsp. variegata]|nr:hypothetical protein BT93_H3671 [Corymbia citriodora subsp. variegata]
MLLLFFPFAQKIAFFCRGVSSLPWKRRRVPPTIELVGVDKTRNRWNVHVLYTPKKMKHSESSTNPRHNAIKIKQDDV